MSERAAEPVALTDEERALAEKLDWRGHPRETYEESSNAAKDLAVSLFERDAIPEIRLEYFRNPEYNTGRTKLSRKEVFERNGISGEAILGHSHFLKHLRCFIYGPDLPQATLDGFRHLVVRCEPITSGDWDEFWEFARKERRQRNLERLHAAEELYN
ncbi:MAG: hypothetical protein MI919_16890 [Holophagales bacterium]|nr:hypothetical protein [Holophagales bacterium]